MAEALDPRRLELAAILVIEHDAASCDGMASRRQRPDTALMLDRARERMRQACIGREEAHTAWALERRFDVSNTAAHTAGHIDYRHGVGAGAPIDVHGAALIAAGGDQPDDAEAVLDALRTWKNEFP